MRVAIVGAGFAGLSTAQTLLSFGHAVTIYDLAPDVGGVWSRTRRYPGIRTQNSKETYALPTLPMMEDYPKHPTGAQVQAYLEKFVKLHRLDEEGRLRLETEVVNATPTAKGWNLQTRSSIGEVTETLFDHLVVATGPFSKAFIPSFPGAEEFTASGGRICHTSDLLSIDEVSGKDVVVVGYGKSACDMAYQVQRTAKSTALVARSVIWKLPTYLAGRLHYSLLLLTRVGEALFKYIVPWKTQAFLNSPFGWPIRSLMLGSLAAVTSAQLKLKRTNLLPTIPFETIARANISLATDGLPEAIVAGSITVHRDTQIVKLSPSTVTLSDGKTLPADVILCGTGFSQSVPSFLPTEIIPKVTDASNGDWTLYRHILPVGVPNLSFNGFNSSLFCPLTADVTSLWIAAHLETLANPSIRLLSLPSPEEQHRSAMEKAVWLRQRTNGKHANGANIIPFSLSNIDEMLRDLGVRIGWLAYLREWLLPVDPSAYRGLADKILARKAALKG